MAKATRTRKPPKTITLLEDATRADGWANALTGLGLAGRDKRLAAEFNRGFLSIQALEELYRGNDLVARVVEVVPDEMLRQGYELLIEDNADLAEAVMALLDEHNADARLWEGLCNARAYGGGGVLLGVVDGQDAAEPLNLDRVKSLDWLTAMSPRELRAEDFYEDAMALHYGIPETYRVIESVIALENPRLVDDMPLVHESRILRFDGVPIPRRFLRANQGWGDSILVRAMDVIRDYQTSWESAALLLQDFAQTVFKIKGLAELVASNADDVVTKRAEMVALSRSIARAVLMDSEEEFKREVTPLTGLPEMLEQFALRMAAAVRMPVTILMGQSPAGLNATGASDIRWFYDTIRSAQTKTLRPALNKLVQIAFRALGAKEPANWSIRFRPLWQPTDQEAAELRNKQASTDKIYLDAGVVTPEEIADSRFGGDDYSTDTQLDSDARDALFSATGSQTVNPAADPDKAEEELPESVESVDPSATLQGPQVAAMLQIVQAVASGQIPRSTGVAMLRAAFPMEEDMAEEIMGEVGRGFTATPKPAPVATVPGQSTPSGQAPGEPKPTQPPARSVNAAETKE